MALSGSFKSNFFRDYGIEFDWSATQNIANNTSFVTVRLYLVSYSSTFTIRSSATKTGRIVIDGTTYNFTTAGASLNGNQRKLIATQSKTVSHNSDGTKSFSIQCYYDIAVTLSGVYHGTVSVSGSGTLNTIPRASSLTSSASWTAGNALPITISRASSSFTHDVVVKVNGVTIKTVTGIGANTNINFSVAENTTIFRELAKDTTNFNQGTSIELRTKSGSTVIGTKTYTGTVSSPNRSTTSFTRDFNIGATINGTITRYNSAFTHTVQLIFNNKTYTLFDKLPNDTSWSYNTSQIANELFLLTPNSNSLSGTIRIFTYFNGVQVRNHAQSTLNAHVVNSNPTIGKTLTYSDINADTVAITNNNQFIIQNHSRVKAILPVASKATAINGASIVEYVANLNGVQRTASYSATTDVTFDFGTINAGTDQTLTIKAVDSRGNTVTLSKMVTMIPYNRPSINATSRRSKGFENETTLTMNGTFSPLSINGVNKNRILSVQYRYKNTNVETAPTWSTWTDFTHTETDNNYQATNVVLNLDNTSSFHIEFMVKDSLSNTVLAQVVSTGQPLLFIDSEKKAVSVNKFPEDGYSLDIKGNTKVDGDLTVNGKIHGIEELGATKFIGDIDMGNRTINKVHKITINDPGFNEGIEFLGGNGWQIFESPDDLSNSGGNIQFALADGRKLTIGADGGLWIGGNVYAPNGKLTIKNIETGTSVYASDGGGLHMKNSDILGLNSMYWSDTCTGDSEAMQFPRSNTPSGSVNPADYDSFRIYDGVGYLNSNPMFMNYEVLWTGGAYMSENQSAIPSRKLSQCPNGWILVWSEYSGGSHNYDFNHTIIHKFHAERHSGTGIWAQLMESHGYPTGKYIYVTDSDIKGNVANNDASYRTNKIVLRYVLSF